MNYLRPNQCTYISIYIQHIYNNWYPIYIWPIYFIDIDIVIWYWMFIIYWINVWPVSCSGSLSSAWEGSQRSSSLLCTFYIYLSCVLTNICSQKYTDKQQIFDFKAITSAWQSCGCPPPSPSPSGSWSQACPPGGWWTGGWIGKSWMREERWIQFIIIWMDGLIQLCYKIRITHLSISKDII